MITSRLPRNISTGNDCIDKLIGCLAYFISLSLLWVLPITGLFYIIFVELFYVYGDIVLNYEAAIPEICDSLESLTGSLVFLGISE